MGADVSARLEVGRAEGAGDLIPRVRAAARCALVIFLQVMFLSGEAAANVSTDFVSCVGGGDCVTHIASLSAHSSPSDDPQTGSSDPLVWLVPFSLGILGGKILLFLIGAAPTESDAANHKREQNVPVKDHAPRTARAK